MKERFTEKLGKFIRKVFELPPTLEELKANFPHKVGCPMSTSTSTCFEIVKSEITVYVSKTGPFDMSSGDIKEERKYLECGGCCRKAQFAE